MRRMEQARQAAAPRRRQKLTVAAAPRKMRVNNRHRQGRGEGIWGRCAGAALAVAQVVNLGAQVTGLAGVA